ncbi:MAG: Tim44 domain-containing protein [Alphaproteobacteria bacterium GM7ARS4]|nr:Tim44 domain-containing protein [Alphaproteobacteria bacterium GM7ARS4]
MQHVDIVLLALVAAFLILRLRSVLGEHHSADNTPREGGREGLDQSITGARGREQQETSPSVAGDGEDVAARQRGSDAVTLSQEEQEQEEDALKRFPALKRVKEALPSFYVTTFLKGVQNVFFMVHEAYTKDTLDKVSHLLGKEVYGNFQKAIKERKAAGHRQESSLVGIESLAIDDILYEDGKVDIVVSILSSQINAFYDAQGACFQGDAEAIETCRDVWVFTRDLGKVSRHVAWSLKETRGG